MIIRKFPFPKDPTDIAPYMFQSFEQLATVVGDPVGQVIGSNKLPGFPTASDALPGGPLTFPSQVITTQDVTIPDIGTVKAGFGLVVWVAGGVPNKDYMITVRYTTVAGAALSRSAILQISGQ